ncbi:hypothetical protein ACFE04_023658 [Oxalis oulophora]
MSNNYNLTNPLFPSLIFLSLLFLYFYSSFLPFSSSPTTTTTTSLSTSSSSEEGEEQCDLFHGKWVYDETQKPLYDDTCPFQRNAWNCIRNKRENMEKINSWKWVPNCGGGLNRVDPVMLLGLMRNKNIGLIGDSLNENFLVAFLCVLRIADPNVKKWKRKGAWKGAYFPRFNVTVAYHRAVLLARHQFQPKMGRDIDSSDGIYRVDVDIPADDWIHISDFYDVLVFNTGHWWGYDKFPEETPLVFYQSGKPILPRLDMMAGLKVVLQSMASYIEREIPKKTLKFWRLQSPRHFYGGDWNQNGSCLFDEPLNADQLDLWYDARHNGVNKEARVVNNVIKDSLRGTDIKMLDLTHMSEFRADAHPAKWLGKKDAVAVWGQDCMHWCLPGVPDTWVDILSELIVRHFGTEFGTD